MVMAEATDIENCYRYILGREMSADEKHGIDGEGIAGRDLRELRQEFLRSPEFHNAHLETLFENLVPQSIPVLYETNLGFKIYLDLRQLHISFGVLNESYDRAEVDLIRKIVPDNGTFIDVGANCGYYSLAVAARENFTGKVISFEPLPPLWHLFEQSIAANGWSEKIELRRIALGHAPGTLPLTDAEFSINAGATRLAIGSSDRASQRMVQVDTLDNVAADLSPDVVKIDIEGAEGLFFHGARKTLQRDRPTLLFEMNPELLRAVSNLSPGDLQNWLQKFQYRLWSVEPEGLIPVSIKRSVGDLIGQRGMQNFVAIHIDRISGLCDRIGDVLMLDEQAAA
jgi:FkbM family methyltransferase